MRQPYRLLVCAAAAAASACATNTGTSPETPRPAPAARPEPRVAADTLAKIEAGLVRIPAGRLPSEYRTHRAMESGKKDPAFPIDTFWLGRYEVTQEEWTAVMGENPSEWSGDPRLPVTNVSWPDAKRFVARLNEAKGAPVFRLPTAEEWEYACRAGTVGRVPLQAKESTLSQYAWWGKNSQGHPHPVGRLKPNAFGLFDILGNVAEWCETPDPEKIQGATLRVTAGANFEDANLVGQDCRPGGAMGETGRDAYTGFRLAKSQGASAAAPSKKKT